MPFIKINDPTAVPVSNLDVSYKKQNEHLFLLRHFVSQYSTNDVSMIKTNENNEAVYISIGSIIELGGTMYHLREANLNIIDDNTINGVCYIKLKVVDNGESLCAFLTNEMPYEYNYNLKGYYEVEDDKLVKYLCVSVLKKENKYYDICPCSSFDFDTGLINMFGGDIENIVKGYLFCDGREISRVGYKKLFDTIGTTWGYGDNATTFNLPDLRGGVPRGIGEGILKNPDKALRIRGYTGGSSGDKVGSYERENFKNHNHRTNQTLNERRSDKVKRDYDSYGPYIYYYSLSNNDNGYITVSIGGSETRMNNFAVGYIIKY